MFTRADDILPMKIEGSASKKGAVSLPISQTDDRVTLAGLRELDSQAIGGVYDQYFQEIHRYIFYRTGDQPAAEDLTSEVFLRLLEAIQNKRGPQTNLKGWLLATASHVTMDHMRQRYRRPVETIPDSLTDGLPGPNLEIELREQNRCVQEAYARLTSEQQHVLALRFGQGYSLEETATHLKKNVNAVKALQFRALASLQRRVGEVTHE
jgi:RNA polymerase sigma-70 factor (ECF subfamily)